MNRDSVQFDIDRVIPEKLDILTSLLCQISGDYLQEIVL